MQRISKREYQTIQLYAMGLTFKEIGMAMNIAPRTAINYYMRVKLKDKGRITRAKKSRIYNKSELNILIKNNKKILSFRYSNMHIKQATILNYIVRCLELAFRSYQRYLLNIRKKDAKKGRVPLK